MSAHSATRTYYCKFPGCQQESRSPVGKYSYCTDHMGQGPKAAPPRAPTNGHRGAAATELRTVLALASQVDKARAKAEKATRHALDLKAKADELERQYRERIRELMGEAG